VREPQKITWTNIISCADESYSMFRWI